jgi:transposase
VEDEEYQLRHERVAGVDIAKDKGDVCMRLPPVREGGRRVSRTETLPATWREVTALGERLLADGVEVVVMESTSDYWRIWYYLLEAAGLAVQLVSPSHARQLAGRPGPHALVGEPLEVETGHAVMTRADARIRVSRQRPF